MSKDNILKTIEDFYIEIDVLVPGASARQYTILELVSRLNPKPRGYIKKGASKIIKNTNHGDKI